MPKTNPRPKVSILCRTYNQEEVIGVAIQSALNQTFHDFELIISDDASTDNTYSRILKFQDPRIRIIRNSENRGAPANLNLCMTEAIGEYVSILDGDDEYLPQKLAKQVEFLDKNPDYGAVFSYIGTIGDQKNPKILKNSLLFKKLLNNPGGTRAQMFRKCFGTGTFLAFPSEMFRRKYAVYFPEHVLALSETNFHLSLLSHTKLHVLEEPLVNYRVVANYTNKWSSVQSLASELYFILDRFLEIKDVSFFKEVFKNDLDGSELLTEPLLAYALTKIAEKDPDKRQWANYNFHRFISNPDNYILLKDKLGLTHKDILTVKRGFIAPGKSPDQRTTKKILKWIVSLCPWWRKT